MSPGGSICWARGVRKKEISESEAGAVLAGSPGGIQGITLDPSPGTLVGECGAETLARMTCSPTRVYSEVADRQ